MKTKVKIAKRLLSILLVFLFSINNFATSVSDNDGSAFITKAEFDALKSSFQSQIDAYNQGIDSKIDQAIASYLAGINITKTQEKIILYKGYSDGLGVNDRYLFCKASTEFSYLYGTTGLNLFLLSDSWAERQSDVGGGNTLGHKHWHYNASTTAENQKRIYVTQGVGGSYVWNGYFSAKDTIKGSVIYLLSKDNDWKNLTSGGDANMFPICWAVHVDNDQSCTVNHWGMALYTETLETPEKSSTDWNDMNAPKSALLTCTQEITSRNFRNIIISRNADEYEYPMWTESTINRLYVPNEKTQIYVNGIYSKWIEELWDDNVNISGGNSFGHYMCDPSSWNYISNTYALAKPVASFWSTQRTRTAYYQNRYVPIMDYETAMKISDVLSYDTQDLTYKKKSGTGYVDAQLTTYKLEAGMPLVVVKDNDEVVWEPHFYQETSLSTSTTPTLYLRYEPFDDIVETTSYTEKVNFTYTGGKVKFKATRPGVIFVKWTKGNALDLQTSNKVTITTGE